MRLQANAGVWQGRLAGLVGGLAVLSATACSGTDPAEAEEAVGVTQQALISWTTLTLKNGWSVYNNNPPAAGILNGRLYFRGAMKGTATASDNPFTLPSSLRPNSGDPSGWDSVRLRVSMHDNGGGTLSMIFNNIAHSYDTHLTQDGFGGPSTAARTLTSLDGVAVDVTSVGATPLDYVPYGWVGVYSFRNQGMETAASGKVANGFVSFQGSLTHADDGSALLAITPELAAPLTVYMPIALCADAGGAFGRLGVSNGGIIFYNGNQSAAACATSLEGATFALDTTGTTAITLRAGWAPSDASRLIRARNDNGVIRLQGAISGGTSTWVGTLPSGMRPSRTIFLVAAAGNSTQARLIINSAGQISVDASSLSAAQGGLSFDGANFAR